MNLLIFDNYDSFTYNLVHAVEKFIHKKPDVYRNDCISLQEIDRYTHIIISPGPGLPKESGILLPMIKEYASKKSILGVCLGQQAIAEVFGGSLKNLSQVYHGIATPVHILQDRKQQDNDIFQNLPATIQAGRYHSWIVAEKDFPKTLEITARDDEDTIMALRHRKYDVQAVQFHPESVLTPLGDQIIKNWLQL